MNKTIRIMLKNKNVFLLFLLIGFLISGCRALKNIFTDVSPRDDYISKLEDAGIFETAAGKEWRDNYNSSLGSFNLIDIPYKETAYFFRDETAAYSYGFACRRGEKLIISIVPDTLNAPVVFGELYSSKANERIVYAEENKIEYSIEENDTLILILQSELLASGSFDLLIEKSPTLAFPVSGKNSTAVKSVFGDPRDAGGREHKGVDIFAPRGTPVVAVTGGAVTRTGTNNLGGKVVWLNTLNKSFYYAHLDSQLVSAGSIVKTGDTLGLVGNTGNARTTPPHLHFGIYVRGEGAIDPLPFIKDVFPDPDELKINPEFIGEWGRIKSFRANFYSAKGKNKAGELNKAVPFKITGGSGGWIKILLPDNSAGYISSNHFEKVERPLESKIFSAGNKIFFNLNNLKENIAAVLKEEEALPVYGRYNEASLVEFKGKLLWIE